MSTIFNRGALQRASYKIGKPFVCLFQIRNSPSYCKIQNRGPAITAKLGIYIHSTVQASTIPYTQYYPHIRGNNTDCQPWILVATFPPLCRQTGLSLLCSSTIRIFPWKCLHLLCPHPQGWYRSPGGVQSQTSELEVAVLPLPFCLNSFVSSLQHH